jgi:hypothetical protein
MVRHDVQSRNRLPSLGQAAIIGPETGNRKGRVAPKKEWIDNLVESCDRTRGKTFVFMKDSLLPTVGEENMRRELPWELNKKGGKKRMGGSKWSDEDLLFLEENAGKSKISEIAAALGRTPVATAKKAYALELSISFGGEPGCTINPVKKNRNPAQTLCWKCRRAGTVNPAPPCAWVRAFKPVVGWTATKTKSGYHVFACPRFITKNKAKTARRGASKGGRE